MNIDDYINNLQSDIDIQLSQFGLNGGQQDTASESEKKFRPECGTQMVIDGALAYLTVYLQEVLGSTDEQREEAVSLAIEISKRT